MTTESAASKVKRSHGDHNNAERLENQRTLHQESHSNHSELISDIIIRFADGLTVPFALTAGLSSVGSLNLVILSGLAELFAGALSVGLGAFLAVVTENKHYRVEEAREWREVSLYPQAEETEIYDVMAEYGLERESVWPTFESLLANKDMWVKLNFNVSDTRSNLLTFAKFMMDFELKLARPRTLRQWISAISMGLSYLLGGLVPMIPYFAYKNINHALFTSIGVTVLILVTFGYTKTIGTGCTGKDAVVSSLQTLLIGVLAASTSYGIVRGFNEIRPVHI